jgi:5-methylcytosine-specific restriction protein A
MTSPHHIEFWARGGRTNLPNLIPLCYVHHRLVHEGGWQVIRAGDRLEFVPPDRPVMTRRRWGERRWAA